MDSSVNRHAIRGLRLWYSFLWRASFTRPKGPAIERASMAVKYAVAQTEDHPEKLARKLNSIAEEGGRVISVMWTPPRAVGAGGRTIESGYTIVWEIASPPVPRVTKE
jgi:hypothetical protein